MKWAMPKRCNGFRDDGSRRLFAKIVPMLELDIAIIGGGAAGFFAAITCAEHYPHARITLCEAGKAPLSKVKISGGGRCNVTHACFEPSLLVQFYPRGGKALRGAFSRFQPEDTIAWYRQRGVELKTESDGRMFPVTDDAMTIVNCLQDRAIELGIKVWTEAAVSDIKSIDGKFAVYLKSGRELTFDRVLLATGSNPLGIKWARSLGHQIIPAVPSLFTFNIKDPRLEGLAGVSVKSARVELPAAGKNNLVQTGGLLVTHWGVSGPAILKLSAWGARFLSDNRYQAKLIINYLPDLTSDRLRQSLLDNKINNPQKTIYNSCPLPLPHRLWESIASYIEIDRQDRWANLSNKTLDRLLVEIHRGEYQIKGKSSFKEEFVTCGGVDLQSVDFKTMSSKVHPHLYFAGEILDIDGVTGGFNFQSAWTTGYLAGMAIGVSSELRIKN
jgi:predicted Rossmann fold flavoprotein